MNHFLACGVRRTAQHLVLMPHLRFELGTSWSGVMCCAHRGSQPLLSGLGEKHPCPRWALCRVDGWGCDVTAQVMPLTMWSWISLIWWFQLRFP